jgi:hypothetical protein
MIFPALKPTGGEMKNHEVVFPAKCSRVTLLENKLASVSERSLANHPNHEKNSPHTIKKNLSFLTGISKL